MTDLTLAAAQTIAFQALQHARDMKLAPLAVVVLDSRGALKAAAAEDGTSLKRAEVAAGKAHGALSLGMGSRAIARRAESHPHFIAAVSHLVGGAGMVPVPGGVLIRVNGAIAGAVGISGDTSDNDEAAAMAGIKAAGYDGDGGA